MRCKNCESAINGGWTFCPACGAEVLQKQNGMGNIFNIGLEDVFNRFVNRSLEEMFRNIEDADFETQHQFKTRNFKGMTVKIVQSGNNPPVINVERFECPRRMRFDTFSNMFPEAEQHSGIQKLESNGHASAHVLQAGALSKNKQEKIMPNATIEPKVDIVRLPGKIVIESELPGVKSIDDIQVLELGESLEIRAFAGKNAYLKIVQIPHEIHVKEKAFSGEKLRVEIGK